MALLTFFNVQGETGRAPECPFRLMPGAALKVPRLLSRTSRSRSNPHAPRSSLLHQPGLTQRARMWTQRPLPVFARIKKYHPCVPQDSLDRQQARRLHAAIGQVSRKSHSSPMTHRSADSLPFSMPHSKSSQGPRFSIPTSSSVRFAAANAPSQISSTTTSGW